MAAQESPRSSNNQHHAASSAAAAPAVAPSAATAPRKSVALQDPEDMVLLREKLNQIAVGRRYVGDNQIDHMDDSDAGEDDYEHGGSARRRRAAPGSGHFRVFLPAGERPSTPPSSPQPRDVLRKQLRMKNTRPASAFYTPQRSLSLEDNNSDTASDEPLDGMCVDAIEISSLPDHDDAHRLPTHPTVRLSVPEHLRVRASSYSVLAKCPEGFRKRKSVHIDNKDLAVDGESVVAPLKKVSSHVNVLNAAAASSPASQWDECRKHGVSPDQDMEDASSDPSGSPPSCS